MFLNNAARCDGQMAGLNSLHVDSTRPGNFSPTEPTLSGIDRVTAHDETAQSTTHLILKEPRTKPSLRNGSIAAMSRTDSQVLEFKLQSECYKLADVPFGYWVSATDKFVNPGATSFVQQLQALLTLADASREYGKVGDLIRLIWMFKTGHAYLDSDVTMHKMPPAFEPANGIFFHWIGSPLLMTHETTQSTQRLNNILKAQEVSQKPITLLIDRSYLTNDEFNAMLEWCTEHTITLHDYVQDIRAMLDMQASIEAPLNVLGCKRVTINNDVLYAHKGASGVLMLLQEIIAVAYLPRQQLIADYRRANVYLGGDDAAGLDTQITTGPFLLAKLHRRSEMIAMHTFEEQDVHCEGFYSWTNPPKGAEVRGIADVETINALSYALQRRPTLLNLHKIIPASISNASEDSGDRLQLAIDTLKRLNPESFADVAYVIWQDVTLKCAGEDFWENCVGYLLQALQNNTEPPPLSDTDFAWNVYNELHVRNYQHYRQQLSTIIGNLDEMLNLIFSAIGNNNSEALLTILASAPRTVGIQDADYRPILLEFAVKNEANFEIFSLLLEAGMLPCEVSPVRRMFQDTPLAFQEPWILEYLKSSGRDDIVALLMQYGYTEEAAPQSMVHR